MGTVLLSKGKESQISGGAVTCWEAHPRAPDPVQVCAPHHSLSVMETREMFLFAFFPDLAL